MTEPKLLPQSVRRKVVAGPDSGTRHFGYSKSHQTLTVYDVIEDLWDALLRKGR